MNERDVMVGNFNTWAGVASNALSALQIYCLTVDIAMVTVLPRTNCFTSSTAAKISFSILTVTIYVDQI